MDRVRVDSKKRICFTNSGRFGVMLMSGDTIIPPKYKRLDGSLDIHFHDFWVISDDEDRVGIMKNDGRILVEPQYDRINSSKTSGRSNLVWKVEKDGLFGLLNSHGTELIPLNYDQIYPIHFKWKSYPSETTCDIGRDKNKYYYLNPNGVQLSSEAYDSILVVSNYSYSSSRSMTYGVIIKNNGKYGVLNPDG